MQFSFQHLNIYFSFLHKATKTSGLRPMEQKDTKAVQELINTYLKQFNLAPVMDEEEVAHWFLPREHIIDTFVVEVKHSLTTSRTCMWMLLVKNYYQHQVFWNAVEIWSHDSTFCSSYCILMVRKCLFECHKLHCSYNFLKKSFEISKYHLRVLEVLCQRTLHIFKTTFPHSVCLPDPCYFSREVTVIVQY